MDNVTVTISIGRGIPGGGDMRESEWDRFRAEVEAALADCRAEVHVNRAHSVGEWDGVPEESATWVAAIGREYVAFLRFSLSVAAGVYRQDAIALTVGDTELVSG